jgi:hypothetical protein
MGFTQSKHNPCMLFTKDLLLILYVDDAGISAPDIRIVDTFVLELRRHGFEFTHQVTFSKYLVITFESNDTDGTITMTQNGLTMKIIEATGMQDCNPNWKPASTLALGMMDPDCPPMYKEWNYPSIVGMLLFISSPTLILTSPLM